MQIGFLNAHSRGVMPRVAELVHQGSRRDIPTIFTTFRNPPDSPYEKLLGWKNMREKHEMALHEAFRGTDAPILEKQFYSAFTGEFCSLVSDYGARTLIICGVSTESCILKTAVDAFEREFTPIVVADSVASDLGDEMHRKGLAIIEVLIGKGQVMNTADLLHRI